MPELTEDSTFLFDDATHYNYGSEWQKIFSRIPRLVDSRVSPEDLKKRNVRRTMERAEAQDQKEAENYHLDLETSSQSSRFSDEIDYSSYHWDSVIGMIWIADFEALQSGKALMAWYDDCGRIVRSIRIDPKEIQTFSGMLIQGIAYELGQWQLADVGDDYEVGGVCCPPGFEQSFLNSVI
ncbi:hypothetical protein B7463_g11577, partial [Scytalidium lignicola]